MRAGFAILIVAALLAGCARAPALRPGETLFVPALDGWEQAAETVGGNGGADWSYRAMYLPRGEAPREWSQLVAVFIEPRDPGAAAEQLRRTVADYCQEVAGTPAAPQTARSNGYETASQLVDCARTRGAGRRELFQTLVVRGNDRTYRVMRFGHEPGRAEQARQWDPFFRRIAACDTLRPAHPCPGASDGMWRFAPRAR